MGNKVQCEPTGFQIILDWGFKYDIVPHGHIKKEAHIDKQIFDKLNHPCNQSKGLFVSQLSTSNQHKLITFI